MSWLVVGAGLTGATVARGLAESGARVTVIERRPYVGGTASDYVHESGLRVQRFGPHVFHTRSEKIWNYVQRFAEWDACSYRVAADVGGAVVPLPLGFRAIQILCGDRSEDLIRRLLTCHGAGARIPILRLLNDPQPELRELARLLWDKVFAGYTRKHWGLDPSELSPAVTARLPVVVGDPPLYFQDPYQAVPRQGFTAFVANILDHPRIHVFLSEEYRPPRGMHVVYTGAVDEFHRGKLGWLPYRTVHFYLNLSEQVSSQIAATVNYPNQYGYTRATDFTRISGQRFSSSALVREYPAAHEPETTEPLYPVLTRRSRELLAKYNAARPRDVVFCGRLGEFRYYNMDQAIASGLRLSMSLTVR